MKGLLLAVAGAAVLTLVATIVFRLFAVRRRAAVRVRVFLLSLFFGGLLQIYNLAERGFSLRILIDIAYLVDGRFELTPRGARAIQIYQPLRALWKVGAV
jgi:hypothetical protein